METSPQETPHCRKTRANQRGRSEEKTYSNVPSRDVQQFSKRGATALRHRVHRTVVNSTNWWLLKQKICVFGQRIQDCAVSLCRFAGKSDQEEIRKNICVEISPQETPHCRKTRANQRGRSEEKTYSNVPSRDVAKIFKTRRNSVTAGSYYITGDERG